jgi:hypothetical protein
MDMRAPCASPLLLFLLSVIMAGHTAAQQLRGRVLDLSARTPIAVVDLAVLNETGQVLARTQSDSLGDFRLHWSSGERVRLRAQRIGYQTSTSSVIAVDNDETLTVRMFMSSAPINVDPLVVSARQREADIMGHMAAIERRRKLGLGQLITREDIRQSGASQIADVLRIVPGLSLMAEPNNPYSVFAYSRLHLGATINQTRSRRRGAAPAAPAPCPMMIFLDGRIHRNPIAGVNVLPTSDIEAIEIFRGLSEVPAEFAGEHARCGVIALWTTRR